MDLNDLLPNDTPAELRLVHPSTGEELKNDGKPVTLLIIGPDTEKMKRLDRGVNNRRLKQSQRTGRLTLDVATIEAETIERLATCIVGWDNIFRDGHPTPYDHQAALDLMKDFPWMRDQVDEFYRNRGNFLKSGETSTTH